ncbi:MAG: LptA/OstA family protein [Verrucomicrobiota bacterium]
MGCMVVLAILGLAWRAAAVEPAKPAKAGMDTNSTVITSTRLNFDQQKRTALFEGNVVVTDREIKILSDRLEVFFTEDNKVDRIEADGRVTIIRNDLKATGAKAAYDMQTGKLQLTGNPCIQRDQDKLTGETVTLWRHSRRILCEPNARLVIASEQDMNRGFK